MAEFSKQYCDLHDQEMTPDFDIDEIAKDIEPGFYLPIICEGFGFIAIGRMEKGDIQFAYRQQDTDYVIWRTYKETVR